MSVGVFQEITRELKSRGAVVEAAELKHIASARPTRMAAPVVEAARLLAIVQAKASKDGLMNIAARASLLSHEVQKFYR
jgi:hypothetical protein